MPRTERTRAARTERVLLLVRASPNGLTEAEIATELGFERRATNNYLRDLEYQNQIYKDDRFAAYLSSNRTCELGMSRATGHSYRHTIELLEELTRPHRRTR